MSPEDDLKRLASILADWSARRGLIIYLFGSRVRGNHRPDSDVDILIGFHSTEDDIEDDWWGDVQRSDFSELKSMLPGPLHNLPDYDHYAKLVVQAAVEPFYQDRNVFCVLLPPKPSKP